VLVGAWYEPDEEVRFDAVQIRFSDLDMWAATSGFTQSFTVDEKRNSMDRIDVAFVPPEPVEVALDDTTSLSITWSFTWSGLKHVTTAVSLEQTALFKVSFAKRSDAQRMPSVRVSPSQLPKPRRRASNSDPGPS